MILPPFLNFLVVGLHMQAVVTIRLYGYMDTNTINKGKEMKE
jgi:hypothetical protein